MIRNRSLIVLMISLLPFSLSAQTNSKIDKDLVSAAGRRDFKKIQQILSSSQPSQQALDAGLIASAAGGDSQAVRLFLEKGANVKAADEQSETPLLAGMFGRSSDVIQALLGAGADPKAVDKDGDSALTLLSFRARTLQRVGMFIVNASPCVVELPATTVMAIIERSGDINVRGQRSETALIRAADCGHVETMRILLEAGADFGLVDADGNSALVRAAASGFPGGVRLILDKGADVNLASASGTTPLLAAAGGGSLERFAETVGLLLTRGASVNAQDRAGDTPLMIAARYGVSEGIVKLLLDKGADVTIKNRKGETASTVAKGSAKKLLANRK